MLAAKIPLETEHLEMEVRPHAAVTELPTPRGTILILEVAPTAGRNGPAWNAPSHAGEHYLLL